MGVFASDQFAGTAGTDLTAHTPNVGGSWAQVSGITGVIKLIGDGTAKGDSGGDSLYYNNGTPGAADYTVEADLTQVSNLDVVGICARLSTGAKTMYVGYFDNAVPGWKLSVFNAGTETVMQSVSSTLGTHVWLTVASTTITLSVQGVAVNTSSVNSAISSAGKAGIFYSNSDWGFGTTGRPMDNFVATDATSSGHGALLAFKRNSLIT